MSAAKMSTLKLTLVGDGGVGKSCLILEYMYGDYTEEYVPTKADAYRCTITLQGDQVEIDILDTAGQEDFPAVRDGYLKHGDGFMIVFDLTNRDTFQALRGHRENVLRVKSDDANLPILLVGNKSDLASSRRVTYEEGMSLAAGWNIDYIETSAKTRENVDRAFSEIFIKIKEMKARRAKDKRNSSLTKEEERRLREHARGKRIKKKCIIL